MIGKIIAAGIGSAIDRSDGRGGIKGAAIGMLAAGAIRRLGPLGLALGGAYLLKRAYDKRQGPVSETLAS